LLPICVAGAGPTHSGSDEDEAGKAAALGGKGSAEKRRPVGAQQLRQQLLAPVDAGDEQLSKWQRKRQRKKLKRQRDATDAGAQDNAGPRRVT
jgi:hypothetical protein